MSTPVKAPQSVTRSQVKLVGVRYFGGLIAALAVTQIPILAGLITIFMYASFPQDLSPLITLLAGIACTLFAWAILAIPFSRFATVDGGNPSSGDGLRKKLHVLNARMNSVQYIIAHQDAIPTSAPNMQPSPPTTSQTIAQAFALEVTKGHLDGIELLLNKSGLSWVLSNGYINVWSRLQLAEEDMIYILPVEIVAEDAIYDQWRLKDSDIPGWPAMHQTLEGAINSLMLQGHAVIQPPPSTQNSTDQQPGQAVIQPLPPIQNGAEQQPKQPANQLPLSAQSNTEQQFARSRIHTIRSNINHYKKARWESLIGSRNILMGIAVLSSLFTYILLCIALVGKVPPSKMLGAAVFFFVGAIVGLFSRLQAEWTRKNTSTTSVVNDYGLTWARIIVTPVLSGLAAIIGVLLVAMLSIVLLTPQPTSGTSIQSALSYPKIQDIYDVNTYPQNLVFAAIFGFLPNLVISALQQQSEDLKRQIANSNAIGQEQSQGDTTSAGQGQSSPSNTPASQGQSPPSNAPASQGQSSPSNTPANPKQGGT